jgi:DNA-binding protein H-NS
MLDLPTLQGALVKVQQRRIQPVEAREQFTQAEIDALEAWMRLEVIAEAKLTRAERSERNKARWSSGDRRQWGGEVRRRDKRRGWRNFG